MLTSLRGKLIFIFILLTVSIVIVTTGFARYKQRQFTLDRAQERAKVDLQLLNSDIQSVLSWIKRDLLLLRDLSSFHEMLNGETKAQRIKGFHEFEAAVLSLATYHKIFQQIRFLNADGQELICVNSKNGRIWLTPQGRLQNKSDRYYFQQAIRRPPEQIYISPMDLNREQGKIESPQIPVIRYALSVPDDDGHTQGVLVLNVLGTTFLNILKDQQKKASPGTEYFLLNSEGYFLFHKTPAKTFGFIRNSNENFFKNEPGLKKMVQEQSQGIRILTSEETYRQTLFAFRQINLAPQGIGTQPDYWILMTTVDNAELLVGMNEYIQAFVPFTLFLLAICIGTAILVARNFSRPVESLASAAKQIHQGDLSARAKVYTIDDMGKFGHLFNEMATKLEQTISRLQLSESKYRHIFENSRDCIFVTDTHCNIIDINSAGKTLLGVDKTTNIDQLSLNCCKAAGEIENKPAIQNDIQKEGYVKDYETWLERPDGSTRHCILTASSRFDDQGLHLGYEGIIRDITAEKKRQQDEFEFKKKLQDEVILAEERQRRHMGQVLHEEMAQNLALVNLNLQEVETDVQNVTGPQQEKLMEQLAGTRDVVKLMIRQIRTMIFDLYPVILDNQGLVPALNWYGDNFTRQTGIEVSVYGVSGSLGLSDSQKIYLFRSFKELLHNAWKHADAKEIVATVKKKNHHVRLTVDDEGKGFIPEKINPGTEELKGIGLVSIRQWITAINGTMAIESTPGKGTRISIDIPLDHLEEKV
jgi:PAS domain S-box-containing protein